MQVLLGLMLCTSMAAAPLPRSGKRPPLAPLLLREPTSEVLSAPTDCSLRGDLSVAERKGLFEGSRGRALTEEQAKAWRPDKTAAVPTGHTAVALDKSGAVLASEPIGLLVLRQSGLTKEGRRFSTHQQTNWFVLSLLAPRGTNSIALRAPDGTFLDRFYVEPEPPAIVLGPLPARVRSGERFTVQAALKPADSTFEISFRASVEPPSESDSGLGMLKPGDQAANDWSYTLSLESPERPRVFHLEVQAESGFRTTAASTTIEVDAALRKP